MAKYDRLFEHLCRAGDDALDMTFDEISALVGGLPPTATRQRNWWANDTSGRVAHAKAWGNAGREVVAVDLDRRVVTFSAARWNRGA